MKLSKKKINKLEKQMEKAAKSFLDSCYKPVYSFTPIQDLSFNIGSGGISSKEASEIMQQAFDEFSKNTPLPDVSFKSLLNQKLTLGECISYTDPKQSKHDKVLKLAIKNLKKIGELFAKESRKPIVHKGLGGYHYFGCNRYPHLIPFEQRIKLYKSKKRQMNEKLIKQIKELPGVKKIEPFDKRFIVTFEPVKQAVECENVEQWDFVNNKQLKKVTAKFDKCVPCIGITEYGYSDKLLLECKDFNLLTFSQYLTDYNLTDEWEAFLIGEAEKRYPVGTKYRSAMNGNNRTVEDNPYISNIMGNEGMVFESCRCLYDNGKWAEIIPDEVELVEGGVYRIKGNRTFRFESKGNNCISYYCISAYSQLSKFGFHQKGDSYGVHIHEDSDIITPATPQQESKLIRAEIKNGYLWKDGKLITLKKK